MEGKCIVILSAKSSGSSACQAFLALTGRVRHVERTRHKEHETLYWTKAASILGRPQIPLLDSEVPIPSARAKAGLLQLLRDNLDLDGDPLPDDDEALIFEGWRRLCRRYAPVFLEKSPHHLYQWSNLELLRDAVERLPEIDFHFVGLVRNPLDTLYSAWRRWRTDPEKNQHQWAAAYRNLLRFERMLDGKVNIVRYEDMVSKPQALAREFEFAGGAVEIPQGHFHRRALSKWRHDRLFGFSPAPEVVEVAKQFGYAPASLTNPPGRFWRAYHRLTRTRYRSIVPFTKTLRRVRRAGGRLVPGPNG